MGGVANPPWVYSPKEVREWINAAYKGGGRRKKEKGLEREDVEIWLYKDKKTSSKNLLRILRYCEEIV